MQYSVVQFSDVLHQFEMRFDADYYKPKYLKECRQLNKHKSILIGDFAFVTDGQHGYHEVDENSPILHLTAKNAKNWFADSMGADRIAKWVDDNNKRSSLIENDLILSTRGTVGYCAIVKSNVLPANIDQDVARIAIDKEIASPEYVLTFLNCKFGQDWLSRNTTGMVQQGLSLQKVRQAPIPELQIDFQRIIETAVSNAYNCLTNSKVLLNQAQAFLLSELGLLDWQPQHKLSFIKRFSDVEQAQRMDAKFFELKHDEILNHIRATGQSVALGSLLSKIQRGKQPSYAETGLPVINSKHVANGEACVDAGNRLATRGTRDITIQCSDVLINGTGVGTIGRCAPYLRAEEALPDNHVTILRPCEGSIDPVYLSVFLNSIVGQSQVDQWFRGSSGQIELYPDDIAQFTIWQAPTAIQATIRSHIEDSFKAKANAAHLLECAKRAVEIAIEQDEETAMKWMEAQT